MFNWFKKKKDNIESEKQIEEPKEYSFKWYELGDENPFNKKILDIRSFIETMIATTSDKSVAERYNGLRSSIGEEYVKIKIPNSKTTSANIEYPHNGAELKGTVFKADSMDCKWDIYVHDKCFFFTRSWTGVLVYKVKADILSDKIILKEIEHSNEIEENEALNSVHFLMKSHATGQPFPHKIPKEIIDEKDIAMWSFIQFGNRACYATYEDIIDTTIKKRE